MVLLNGFAGAGKTTIARMYIDNHPLAMVVEGDELVVNIGHWLDHEDEARDLVFVLTKKMLETAIQLGHDVILPCLVTNIKEVEELEQVATSNGSQFYEFYLSTPKNHAIQRLMNRGTWGEAGSPPITKNDTLFISRLYDRMESALQSRSNQIHIEVKEETPADTYQQLLAHLR